MSDCIEFSGYVHRSGYGRRTWAGKKQQAHRVVMMELGFDIEGKVVHHECGRKSCVNPEHLRVLPQRVHQDIHNERRLICVKCGSKDLVYWSHGRGKRRWRCRACNRRACRLRSARLESATVPGGASASA